MKAKLLASLHACLFLLVICNIAERAYANSDAEEEEALQRINQMLNTPLFEQQVTNVSRKKSDVGQSAAAVFVITSEMIRRSTASNIPELLRMVPGLDVARIDNNKWAINSRGFNERFANKLLVQIDGRTLYNPLNSGVYWDTVDYPLQDIERIEVTRGPGGSVWGANAVNGIISIITKSADKTQGALVSAGGGKEERYFETGRFGDKIGEDLSYRVYGKGFNRDEQTAREGGDSEDAWHGGSTGLKFDWDSKVGDKVTLQGDYLRSVSGREDFRPLPQPPFIFHNQESEKTDAGNILARWHHDLSSDSNYELQFYWDRFDRKSQNTYSNMKFNSYDLDFHHEFAVGEDHDVIYGLNYHIIDAFTGPSLNDDGFAISYSPAERQPQVKGAFIQDEYSLVKDTLAVIAGSKFEYNDFTGYEIQPTARLLWTPTKNQSVWSAISRAVRTPKLSEDTTGATLLPSSETNPTFNRIRANKNFDSENAISYELGYRVQAQETVSVDTAFFYTNYDSLRVQVPLPLEPGPVEGSSIAPQLISNGMDGYTYGAEISTSWKAADYLTIAGGYTYLQMNLTPNAEFPESAQITENQSPENQFRLSTGWSLPYDVEFDLNMRYIDSIGGFNPSGSNGAPDVIDAYIGLDARVGYKVTKNLELSVVGTNLTDDKHSEFGTSQNLNVPGVEIERAIYGVATLHW